MDPHERLGPNQSAKIEAECLTTAQSTAKMQVRSGSKSLSVQGNPAGYGRVMLFDPRKSEAPDENAKRMSRQSQVADEFGISRWSMIFGEDVLE